MTTNVVLSRRALATVGVVLSLLLTGCIGAGGILSDESGAGGVDEAELRETIESTDSYEVEITRTLKSGGVNETATVNGIVDRSDQRAQLTSTSETDVGFGPRISESEQYIIEDTQYTKSGGSWEQTTAPGTWNEVDRLEGALETLENAEFERIRTETADGTETTMFAANISDDRENELAGADSSQHVAVSVEDLVYYVLVDTETNTLYGTDLRMDVSQGGEPARVTIETTFTNHNDAGEISLPEDVAEMSETE
ncbi:hypothetical protein [Natronorubrum sp. A-ect3]|uniref:hypothetical protein n=1 Tax=Natronorubrum sp. A-ect3 TaxID=3242698 RepID=UPI00359F0105